MKKEQIYYFNSPGKENTNDVIDAVKERLKKKDIKHLVVASSRGNTISKCLDKISLKELNIVTVTLHTGFKESDRNEFPHELRKELENQGVKFVTGSHSLSGVGRSVSKKFGGTSPVEIIGHTLRLFCGHGLKVCIEIAVMAADAGHIPTTEDVIVIGGSHGGADTALVMKAAHMNNFFDLEIKEILAKPVKN